MKRLDALRAEMMMRVGGFIQQHHESAFKRGLARLLIWANRRRYSKDALDFLEAEPSIDNFDFDELDSGRSTQEGQENSFKQT